MILCDNIIFELQAIGGISKYWSKTISRLDTSTHDIAFLEGPGALANTYRCELRLNKPVILEGSSPTFRRFTGPKVASSIFHSSYYRISSRSRFNVVTIHDFMNEKYPTSYRDKVLAYLKKRACRHAEAITVVSERTRQDLLSCFPFVDPGRIHVTYNGVDKEFFPEPLTTPFGAGTHKLTPMEYFLYVGTRGYCKNFPFVLRFVAEAHNQGLNLPLVIVGGGALNKSELASASNIGIPTASLVQVSGLPDDVLRRLYSNCLALLIPSIYEGFGLPAAEAARCGGLVLSSRGSALDEIVGDTDYSFDLQRQGEISRVLSLGLNNASASNERQRLIECSKIFDWGASTEKLTEIYDDLRC